MGYKRKAIKGIAWTSFLSGVTRIIILIKIGILARVLSPADFGLFAIASLSLSFVEIITETGINAFLVQEKSNIRKYLNTTWVISLMRGAVISALIFLFSGTVAQFFSSPESASIIRLIGLTPLLRGFINPAVIIFQKELQFNKEFYFRSSIYLFDAIVASIFAIITKSVTGIIWGMIAGVLLEISLSWLLVKPTPRFVLDKKKAIKIFRGGRWITLSGIFNYLFKELDDIVVGKAINIYALGLYQLAYKIGSLPTKELGGAFGRVIFPVFTKIREDKIRLKRAFVKIILGSTFFLLPYLLIVLLFTNEIVVIFLGNKWIEAVPAIRILVIFGVIRSFSSLSSALFLSLKKQKYNSILTFTGVLSIAITIIPFVNLYGILGAAYSVLIGSLIELIVTQYFLYSVFYKE